MNGLVEPGGDGHRSGFVTLVGRPNVGKSTLLNRLLGQKVTIVSDKPQTTRTEVRGVLTRPDVQAVFCDTPGIHKPRTLLGERLNDTARAALGDMDVVLFLVEADGAIGRGDKFIAAGLPKDRTVLVVNKADLAGADRTVQHLTSMLALRAADRDRAAVVKTTATVAEGVDELLAAIDHHETTVRTDRAGRRRNRTRRLLASRAADLLRESLLRTGGSGLDLLCTALEHSERTLDDCARAALDLKRP